ncbi:M24 family metallopeptidase [Mesorhizobium sp. B4-1-4]|uniref:M24 family metallopeptidase n=1 Tax=Mesorhizobium sp. B4-1-4 TaxID=2589888 RepID=UPI00112E9AB1|nr:Xaa-Pro peptidase family protein [Mesorhizobium sp. B4-1-4]UCI34911.1 Xaa-Pro peptidase family protein [Mesorhizobium sp. B4-1-4]
MGEYSSRQKRVLDTANNAGIDATMIAAHGHLRYLTGYHGGGGYFGPFVLILTPGHAPVYLAREYEVQSVRDESCVGELDGYAHLHEFASVCADRLRKLGLHNKRAGMELGCWNLARADVMALQAELLELEVVDANKIIARVSAVTADVELKAMRDAMAVNELAIRTFQSALREGVSEMEIAELINERVSALGASPVILVSFGFGDRNELPHERPSAHQLSFNEPAMIEVGGVKDAYVGALVRSAVLGRHAETEAVHALAEEAVEAAIVAARPGATAGEFDCAVRGVVERSGRADGFRHRTGYQVEASWNDSLEPEAKDIIEKGMAFDTPIILFSENGCLFGCSEKILATERGGEPLSTTSHELLKA